MFIEAAYNSLRRGLLVLISAAIIGCSQPTVRPFTTQSFAEPASAALDHQDEFFPPSRDPAMRDGADSDTDHNLDFQADESRSDSPVSAWERMQDNFQFPETSHAHLNRQIALLQNNARSLQHALDRAAPYMGWILDQIEARDMPAELALLPVIESGYQPFAQSPSQAAGLWQFMPATGDRFGLKQNWWYDGRRDVVASTEAALEYLSYLHDRFDGDWLLALAAYNAGEGRIDQAIRKNRDQNKPTDFWSLELPSQTTVYVPKLLALRDIIATPGHYSIKLPEVSAEAQIALVETPGQIDLGLAAKLAGIPVEDVYRLNPGFNRWATDPAGPHRLVIPAEIADTFADHIANLPADQHIAWERHKVTRGETLVQIAKRHDTSVALLRKANKLSSNSVKAGNNLLIPVAAEELSTYSLSKLQRQEQQLRSKNRTGSKTYVVRNGDTLWGISKRYNLSVAQLTKLNGMSSRDKLQPGTKLLVGNSTAQKTVVASAPTALHQQTVHYTVRKGDSLIQISRRYRVAVNDLLKWNGLKTDDYIRPGQKLKLQVDVTRQASDS
ncbi:MAG: LysM peptidoglycan-binding domain-containing protein [Gammaproteobacteria bacterium]|nr:LysM peptidoglycan-binding domain-containing protein [Gammaproteobacteria bacterium]